MKNENIGQFFRSTMNWKFLKENRESQQKIAYNGGDDDGSPHICYMEVIFNEKYLLLF